MELLTKELIKELLAAEHSPSLSLYMPMNKHRSESPQNIIRFNNLLKEMEESLRQKYSADEVREFINPIKDLSNNNSIWNKGFAGMAAFSAKGLFIVVGLNQAVEELVIVADSFHTKPLRKLSQSLDHYHVLGLSLHDFILFEGNRDSLTEIELSDDMPRTITEALGDKITDKNLTFGTYGGIGGGSTPMYHGHGDKNEETEKDSERYFRMVAQAVHDHYSKPSGWPLILVALPEHHNLFNKVNKNPLLLSNTISIDPSSISKDKLVDMAWDIMEPEYNQRLDSLIDRFEQASADGKGSDDYREVAKAAVEGRVDTLIIEADRIIPIKITDYVSGETKKKDLTNPKVDDLLDDMGELVIKMGGEVMVMPKNKMPSDTGLAAIYRY